MLATKSLGCSLVVIALILVAMNSLPAQDADRAGWTNLFDGETLEGWEQKNGWANYRVEDGAIVGRTATGSPNSFLCTTDEYGDFELTFEVKVDDRLNSGVQIRSHSKDDYKNGRVHGPQVEIEASPGEAGYIYSEGTGRGWISQQRKPHELLKNGKWNHYRVRAVGDRLQTWINGQAVEDLRDEESPQSGSIGLQVHGISRDQGPYEVRWRNIRIRPLKPAH